VATAILVHADLEMARPTDTTITSSTRMRASSKPMRTPSALCSSFHPRNLHHLHRDCWTSFHHLALTALQPCRESLSKLGERDVQGAGAPQLLPPTEPRSVYWGVIAVVSGPGAKDLADLPHTRRLPESPRPAAPASALSGPASAWRRPSSGKIASNSPKSTDLRAPTSPGNLPAKAAMC